MTLHGVVNLRIPADPKDGLGNTIRSTLTFSGSSTLYNAMSASMVSTGALSEGVTLVSTGTFSTLTNLLGTPQTSIGKWSIWSFVSASQPFYMLLQTATGAYYPNTFRSPFPTDLMSSSATVIDGGVGVSFAACINGANPYPVTRSVGTPLWSSASGSLYVWPRSNMSGGQHSTYHENMMVVADATSIATYGGTFHFLFDRDNVTLLRDFSSNDSYSALYFGKMNQLSNYFVQYSTTPYIALNSYDDTTDPPFSLFSYSTLTASYGSPTGDTIYEGGVSVPTASGVPQPGNIQYTGVKTAILDMPAALRSRTFNDDQTSLLFPNTCYPTSVFDVITMNAGAFDVPHNYGILGSIPFWGITANVNSRTMNSSGTYAAFGNNANISFKIVVPWVGNSAISPSTGTLLGTYF